MNPKGLAKGILLTSLLDSRCFLSKEFQRIFSCLIQQQRSLSEQKLCLSISEEACAKDVTGMVYFSVNSEMINIISKLSGKNKCSNNESQDTKCHFVYILKRERN